MGSSVMRRCALVKQGALMLMLIIVIESERSDVALHARESAINRGAAESRKRREAFFAISPMSYLLVGCARSKLALIS